MSWFFSGLSGLFEEISMNGKYVKYKNFKCFTSTEEEYFCDTSGRKSRWQADRSNVS